MMNSNIADNIEIQLTDIGKRYNKQWIFKDINLTIQSGDRLEVQGSNGSGKSTFLQIISGFATPSTGKITWKEDNTIIPVESVFRHISLAAPYVDLIEEFTLEENVAFFVKAKPLQENLSVKQFIELAELTSFQNRYIKNFSSGMKQRLKLALAILSDSDILLLDEPLSNLDNYGYNWYQNLCEKYIGNRIMIVCSNKVKEETMFCNRSINIEKHKPDTVAD